MAGGGLRRADRAIRAPAAVDAMESKPMPDRSAMSSRLCRPSDRLSTHSIAIWASGMVRAAERAVEPARPELRLAVRLEVAVSSGRARRRRGSRDSTLKRLDHPLAATRTRGRRPTCGTRGNCPWRPRISEPTGSRKPGELYCRSSYPYGKKSIICVVDRPIARARGPLRGRSPHRRRPCACR